MPLCELLLPDLVQGLPRPLQGDLALPVSDQGSPEATAEVYPFSALQAAMFGKYDEAHKGDAFANRPRLSCRMQRQAEAGQSLLDGRSPLPKGLLVIGE